MNNVIVQRPWGWQTTVSKKTDCEINEVVVRGGCTTELTRRPQHKTSFIVLSGNTQIATNETSIDLIEHDYYLLPDNEWYKIINLGKSNCRLIEILHQTSSINDPNI